MTQHTSISVAIDRLGLTVASPTMQGKPGMLGWVQSFEVQEASGCFIASLISPRVSSGEYHQLWRKLEDQIGIAAQRLAFEYHYTSYLYERRTSELDHSVKSYVSMFSIRGSFSPGAELSSCLSVTITYRTPALGIQTLETKSEGSALQLCLVVSSE